MSIRLDAMIFDFDDTLVVEQDAARRAFLEASRIAATHHDLDVDLLATTVRQEARRIWRTFAFVRRYCLAVGISSSEGLWANFDGDDPNLRWLRRHRQDYRRRPWEHALREQGVSDVDLAEHLGQSFVAIRETIVDIYPDVIEGLERLRRTHGLALLTNGAPDLQRRKISASGLDRFFEVVVISGDHGEGKPASSIFQTTLNRLGTLAAGTQMVGDSIEHDIAGAQAFGMRGVWLNREGVTNTTETRPNDTIASLVDL